MAKYKPEEWVSSYPKRSIDIAVASAGLVPAIPLVGTAAFISIALERESPFFVQAREGFPMLKLRTMPSGTPEMRAHDLPENTVTPYQQHVRRTRLNELPQLANVLAGHMSLVGPRAQIAIHREETLDSLTPPQQKEWLAARRLCRPGLFDPYVISHGLLNDGSADDPVARAHSDIDYCFQNASPEYDLRVVAGWLRGALKKADTGRQLPAAAID